MPAPTRYRPDAVSIGMMLGRFWHILAYLRGCIQLWPNYAWILRNCAQPFIVFLWLYILYFFRLGWLFCWITIICWCIQWTYYSGLYTLEVYSFMANVWAWLSNCTPWYSGCVMLIYAVDNLILGIHYFARCNYLSLSFIYEFCTPDFIYSWVKIAILASSRPSFPFMLRYMICIPLN